MRLGVTLGVLGTGLLAATSGLAQAPAADRAFSLDYSAPAECPDGLTLVTAVQARTEHAALVPADVAAVRFTARLLEDGRTKLDVDLPEGSFRREFSAPCQDALASIAIIAAMVLETEPTQRKSLIERPSESPAAEAAFPAEEPAPASPAPKPTDPTPPKPVAPASPPPARPRAPPPDRLVLAALAGGGMETAVAPTPPLGVSVGLEGFLDRTSSWAPSVAAGMFATTTSTHTTSEGEGQFRLFAGHVRACGWRLPIGAPFRLMPCLVVEAGSLYASGGGAVVNVRTPSMPWLAGGAVLRVQLDLARALALEASGGLKVLARRDRFVFRPGRLVYEVPRWSAGLGLGLSLRLP
ncbi:MAG TPA: hypothetical protein VJN18_25550 [Polyangiaceae bacterium]|nr:hypothetical protein [Polyangiaceae bacterium]